MSRLLFIIPSSISFTLNSMSIIRTKCYTLFYGIIDFFGEERRNEGKEWGERGILWKQWSFVMEFHSVNY